MLPEIFFKKLKEKKKLIFYKSDSLIFELGKNRSVTLTNTKTNEIEIYPNMLEAYHINRQIIQRYENVNHNGREKIVYGSKIKGGN